MKGIGKKKERSEIQSLNFSLIFFNKTNKLIFVDKKIKELQKVSNISISSISHSGDWYMQTSNFLIIISNIL